VGAPLAPRHRQATTVVEARLQRQEFTYIGSRIAFHRRMVEALAFREAGHNYDEIGERLKCSPSNAYKLVVKAMDRIIAEPAKRVLDRELRRLDILQTSIFVDASQGDLAAQAMHLRLADHRAKLLGLYPKEPQVNLNIGDGDGSGATPARHCRRPRNGRGRRSGPSGNSRLMASRG
jgi:hypothetical protein